MKSYKKIVFSALAAFCFPVFARGAQELIPATSWVYDAVSLISIEAGIVNFSDSTPVTIAELKSYLNEIDREKLSKAGKKQYDRIFEYFDEKGLGLESSLLSLTAEPSVNLEGYYKTNDDISWTFDRYERSPFLELPVTLAMSDFVTMKMDLYLAQNKNTMLENDIYCNVPLDASEFDVNFPDSAYISTGYNFNDECGVSFFFGSPERSIGRTGTSSIIYSEKVTGATAGQLSLYSPNLKYSASITQLGTYADIHANAEDTASGEYSEYETSSGYYLYMHQLEARLFNKITLSAVEGLSVYAPFELRYLNPLTIMHGYAAWRDYGLNEAYTCDYFGLKLNYIPAKHWRVYGLFAMSQYQTPYELDNYGDDVTPNGLGGQLGLESYIPYGDGYFHLTLDGCYTQPYLYVREAAEWSLVRYYRENMGDTKYILYEWVGSPFGPDTISAELSFGYEIPSKFSVDLVYLFLAQGEKADLDQTCFSDSGKWIFPTTWDEANASTPSGIPKYTNRVSLRGCWQATDYVSLVFQPSFVAVINNSHVAGKNANGFEAALSVKCDIVKLLSGK